MRPRSFPLALAIVLFARALPAQITGNNIITTFAGSAWNFPNGVAAKNAPIGPVIQAHLGPGGAIVFADPGNDIVGRIEANGTITVLAGNGIRGFSGDGGPARSASLNQPSDAVIDNAGNLYIFDGNNSRIRRVTPNGIISTVAGTGVAGFLGDDGPAIDARLNGEVARLALDAAGNLYFSSGVNIRRITPAGIISTFAGNRGPGQGAENVQARQTPVTPQSGAMVFDAAGNMYFCEGGSNRIRRITPAGVISTFAGTGAAGFRDGPAANALFTSPRGLAIDAAASLYVGEGNRVRKIAAGVVTTIAGTGLFDSSGDGGPALNATFRFVQGLVFDRVGNLYVAEYGSSKFRVITPGGMIDTAAGNGQFRNSPDGTAARNSYLFLPTGISFDPAGNLLIPDLFASRLRRVKPDGTIQVIAGIGAPAPGRTGVAVRQPIGSLRSAVGDARGNVYWSDVDFSRVMRVAPDGQLSIFVDDDVVKQPQGLALDAAGNLYVADTEANVIRRVTPAGVVTTVVGTGTKGFAGDGGPSTQARLDTPRAVAIDPAGNLVIADSGNNRLRRVTPAGIITTIAGNGQAGPPEAGVPALEAGITGPFELAIDAAGNICFLTSINSTVWQLTASTGTIVGVAGNGKQTGFAGDGSPAKGAPIDATGLTFDARGNLYIADAGGRIRVVLVTPPAVSLSSASLSFEASSNGAATDPQALKVASSMEGFLYTVRANQPWLKIPQTLAASPSSFEVSADPTGLAPGTYTGSVGIGSPFVAAPVAQTTVRFTVLAPLPPKLAIDTDSLTLSGAVGATIQTQSFRVRNAGGGSLDFAIEAGGQGGAAIAIDTASGSVQPASGIPVTVSLNPDVLAVGTYQASIAISSRTTSETVRVPVTISVAPRPQRMALPQKGLLFTAVQGGGVTPPQPVSVLNVGQGSFTWRSQVSVLSGESGWLSASPDTGSSDAASASGQVVVRVDHGRVSAPGIYYGLVRVIAEGATNSPQDVQVVLNLLPTDQNPGAVVGPSGIVFTSSAGASPGSQTFVITNLSASDARYALTTLTLDLSPWLQAAPDRGVIPAGGSQTITVQSKSADLPPGVYDAQVALQVEDTSRAVKVLLVVAPGLTTQSAVGRSAGGCTPTKLIPVFTSFLQDFTVPAAWPIPLEVKTVDDCGTPHAAGRQVTTFSNGDPPLPLISLKDGRWQGAWFGANLRAAKIAVTSTAEQDAPQIRGSLTHTGTLMANNDVPTVTPGAVRNAAPALSQAPLAPGSLISIGGKNFGAGQAAANQLPLDVTLAGTQVILAGRSLPMIYSSGGLINAIVPYDVDPDALYSLLVARGGAVSGPVAVAVAAAQPGVLKVTASEDPKVAQDLWTQILSGADADAGSATPGTAVQAGATLTVYCTGLGALDSVVDAALAASSTPPKVKNPVLATIGGVNAPVSSATLVSGYTGLYQVKLVVPSGVSAGDGIPLVVSVLGKTSVPVNLSVR